MSIQALAWAIKASIGLGLSSNDKLVLWQIADHHNVDNGAFIRQDTMARQAEISRATVNRCLDHLEAVGMIRREARTHPVTKQQLPTRYWLAFEDEQRPQGVVGRVSKRDTENRGPSGEQAGADPVDDEASRVSKPPVAVSHGSETLTLREPITPLPPSPVEFHELVKCWAPEKLGNAQTASNAWNLMPPEQRRQAQELAELFRQGCFLLKRPLPTLANYLSARLYGEFVDAPLIESDRFKITPARPEWRRWCDWIGRRHGMSAQRQMLADGLLRTETRWPPDAGTTQPEGAP